MNTGTPLYNLYVETRKAGGNKKLSYTVNHDNGIKEILINETSFLPDDSSISERLYCYINDMHSTPTCPYCGDKLRYYGKMNRGYYATCGKDECKKIGMKCGASSRTIEERRLAAAKGKLTYFKRTGYYHNMQNPEDLKKWQLSFKEKYGVISPLQHKTFCKKSKESILNRFGTLDMFHTKKSLDTIKERYGSIENMNKEIAIKRGKLLHELKKSELDTKLNKFDFSIINSSYNDYILKCNKCNKEFSITRQGINYYYRNNTRFCPKCDYKNMTFRSRVEKSLADDINKFYYGEIQYNKHFGNYEVDIFIPESNLAIEINGLYWHSDLFHDKYYHINKKRYLANFGIDLIYVWEDELNDTTKKDIVLSRLKSKLGICKKIYARNCVVKKYMSKDVKFLLRPFLDENHLHGFCGGSVYYGLEYNNMLVELIVIGKCRKLIGSKKYEYELIRLCTKKNFEVVGGFSKLIKHSMADLKIENIISYADLSWSSLNKCSYLNIGFKFIKITEPSYWWVGNGVRFNRLNFTKSKLIKEGYNKNKSEDEIMKYDKKYLKVWGPGNILICL